MITKDELVGYMRAAFARSGFWRSLQLWLQFGVALAAGLAVFVSADVPTYYLALGGVALLAAWVWADASASGHRDAAEAARRALILWDGLGQQPSAAALFDLRQSFKANAAAAKALEDPNYYASSYPPGPRRLAEIIEESAFWSGDLQRQSAVFMGLAFGGMTVLLVGAALIVLPLAPNTLLLTLARLFLVFLVFVLSSDVWGTCFGHFSGARAIGAIGARLRAAGLAGFPEADVFLAASNYNAAVERAPMQVPITYRFNKKRLNELWIAYKEARLAERSSS